jgi:hypothetical protein
MCSNLPNPTDRRRLIAAADDQTLNGLAKFGDGDERRMATAELGLRGCVMSTADRMLGAADRIDVLFAGGDPADALMAEDQLERDTGGTRR